MEITFLGIDAGSKNAGYGVISVRVRGNKVKYKIHECGKLNNLLNDLKKPAHTTLKAHVKELKDKINKYGVTYILAERFMNRGRNGVTGEYVNQMLGAFCVSIKQEMTQIPAATWKNRVNKFFDLRDFYKFCYRVEPHEVDAVLQAMWLAEKKTGKDIFIKFKSAKKRNKLREMILCKTMSELKKERKR